MKLHFFHYNILCFHLGFFLQQCNGLFSQPAITSVKVSSPPFSYQHQQISTPKKLKSIINKMQPEISNIYVTPLQVQ